MNKIYLLPLIILLQPHIPLGQGLTISFKGFKVVFTRQGAIKSIAVNGTELLTTIGAAIWGSNWSTFYHQAEMNGEAWLEDRGESKILHSTFNFRNGKLSVEGTSDVEVWRQGVIFVRVSVNYSGDVESVAWGGWGLPVSLYRGLEIQVCNVTHGSYTVRLPYSLVTPCICYDESALQFSLRRGDIEISVVQLNHTLPPLSIDDERAWEGSEYAFKWYIGGDAFSRRFPSRGKARFEAAILAGSSVYADSEALRLYRILSMISQVWPSLEEECWQMRISIVRGDIQRAMYTFNKSIEYVKGVKITPYGYYFSRLRSDGEKIIDEYGTPVILRGVDYSGLEYGFLHQSPEDFSWMASKGFNVLRLPVSMEYLMPERGRVNRDYLNHVMAVFYWAKAYGLYIVLDVHQWRWSRAYGGCGLPDWLVPYVGDYHDASGIFFSNREYWLPYAEAWKIYAGAFGGDPALAGYDIFNEPMPSQILPVEALSDRLPEFYRFVASKIRSVDPEAMIFINPVWGGERGTPSHVEIGNTVLDVHLYPGNTWDGVTGYEHTSRREIEELVEYWIDYAEKLGVPLWVGEFGCGSQGFNASGFVYDFLQVLESKGLGYAYWTYGYDDLGYALKTSKGEEKTSITSCFDRISILSGAAHAAETYIPESGCYYASVELTGGKLSLRVSRRNLEILPSRYIVKCTSKPLDIFLNTENGTLTFKFSANSVGIGVEERAQTRMVGIIANSIDWTLTGISLMENLKARNFNVARKSITDYHNGNYQCLIILGGPLAPEGVGETVKGIATQQEIDEMMKGGIIVKQVNGRLIIIISGKDRYQTLSLAGQVGKIAGLLMLG